MFFVFSQWTHSELLSLLIIRPVSFISIYVDRKQVKQHQDPFHMSTKVLGQRGDRETRRETLSRCQAPPLRLHRQESMLHLLMALKARACGILVHKKIIILPLLLHKLHFSLRSASENTVYATLSDRKNQLWQRKLQAQENLETGIIRRQAVLLTPQSKS